MAGDIGTIIQSVPWGTYQPLEPVELSPGIFAVIRYYNGAISIYTYSCDVNGVMASIDGASWTTVSGNCTQLIHIAGDVYAFGFSAQYVGAGIKTVIITSAGLITDDVIATYRWHISSPQSTDYIPVSDILHISGTVYTVISYHIYDGSYYSIIRTFNISDDGLTMSGITTYTILVAGTYRVDFKLISGNVYAVFINVTSNPTLIKTYTISNAGAISAVIGTFTLDSSAPPGAGNPRACFIAGAIWAVAYPTASTKRVSTVTINPDGTFGAVISTVDGLFAANSVHQLYPIPVGYYGLASGGATGLSFTTITISTAGVIGAAVVDTLAGITGYAVYLVQVSGTLYAGWYVNSSWNRYLISVYIDRGVVYPSDAIIRVTDIIHLYNRATQQYTMECSVGGVTSDFGLPQWLSAPQAAVSDETIKPVTEKEIETVINKYGGVGDKPYGPEPPPPINKYGGVGDEPYGPQPLSTGQSLWSKITPWNEQAGETFGAEVMERVRSVNKARNNIWQAITPWSESKGETYTSEVIERFKSAGNFIRGLFK